MRALHPNDPDGTREMPLLTPEEVALAYPDMIADGAPEIVAERAARLAKLLALPAENAALRAELDATRNTDPHDPAA